MYFIIIVSIVMVLAVFDDWREDRQINSSIRHHRDHKNNQHK